jgi:rod shape determining protein RodA
MRTVPSTKTGTFHKLRKLHMPLLLLVMAACATGFAMLYSAAQGSFDPWASRQMIRFAMIFPVLVLVALIDIQVWFRYAYVLYGIGLVTLVAVEIAGFVGMGAQRWINLGGVNFQPSEMMKIFLVLAIAHYFHAIHKNNITKLGYLSFPSLLLLVPAALVLVQPNLGTSFIILMTGVGLFFMAGIGWKKFVVVGVMGLSLLPVLWGHMHDYQKRRVMTFLDPETDPLGAGYNIIQSKIAIGSGGLVGKGFLQGSQSQLSFLPEKETDFIFTMLAEEFGFVGGVAIVVLYVSIIFCCIRISFAAESYFGKLVAFGMGLILFLHMMINMAMVMGLIPVVGVPLPMLSYGGSSLISMLIGLAFVQNIHIHKDVPVRRTYEYE